MGDVNYSFDQIVAQYDIWAKSLNDEQRANLCKKLENHFYNEGQSVLADIMDDRVPHAVIEDWDYEEAEYLNSSDPDEQYEDDFDPNDDLGYK